MSVLLTSVSQRSAQWLACNSSWLDGWLVEWTYSKSWTETQDKGFTASVSLPFPTLIIWITKESFLDRCLDATPGLLNQNPQKWGPSDVNLPPAHLDDHLGWESLPWTMTSLDT